MCGEKGGFQRQFQHGGGSPPRMRGKEVTEEDQYSFAGITPACAGKRLSCSRSAPDGRDHPRVCGEKIRVASPRITQRGSPPRVRGKVPRLCKDLERMGITPACAGKSAGVALRACAVGDHPRVCGEKVYHKPRGFSMQGSPPRMRGKADQLPGGFWDAGITPAYAGKSRPGRGAGTPYRDHPRVCGEKALRPTTTRLRPGSPPRMRGKVLAALMPTNALGITPAYAGKSLRRAPQRPLYRDHPRVCGEKGPAMPYLLCSSGSPPRMRGKEGQPGRVERGTGITPAYAGKSGPCPDRGPPAGDHPRVCGEKLPVDVCIMHQVGSPPRMRGKALISIKDVKQARITPAYAGKRQRRKGDANDLWDHPRVCGEKLSPTHA